MLAKFQNFVYLAVSHNAYCLLLCVHCIPGETVVQCLNDQHMNVLSIFEEPFLLFEHYRLHHAG